MRFVILNIILSICVTGWINSQSGTSGNTVIHSGGEMTIYGTHNFFTGGQGILPGIIATKRDGSATLSFINNAVIIGASNAAHVDGYARNYNIPSFTFPIGDDGVYGPVHMLAQTITSPFTAAYFHTDPAGAVTSSIFGGNELPLPPGAPFNRNLKSTDISQISDKEYWDVDGVDSVMLTFYWQSASAIDALTSNTLASLRLAGWDGSSWVQIPSAIQNGSSLSSGSISTSNKIIPDQFYAYTFAASNCLIKPRLTVGEISCNGSLYSINYWTDATEIVASHGVVIAGKIINIPSGSSVKITAGNSPGCEVSFVVNLPAFCDEHCVLPQLSVGQPVCDQAGSDFYKLAYADPTNSPIVLSNGVRTSNQITQVPIGTDLIINVGTGSCQISFLVPGITDCDNNCDGSQLSLSAPVCTADQNLYFINYAARNFSAIAANFGQILPGRISGIPVNASLEINATGLFCNPHQTYIAPVLCTNNALIIANAWHDLNGDGIKQTNEPPMQGIQVNLYRSTGAYLFTRITDADGNAVFSQLFAGSYYLEYSKPAEYSFSPPNKFPLDFNSDVNGSNGPNTTGNFVVARNASNVQQGAGYFKCVPIGQYVWYDINKNDVRDVNENGINGLVAQLWKYEDGNWQQHSTTITGHKPGTPSDDGWWNFCAPPGQYYIKIIMPPLGLVQALPFKGGNPFTDSDLTNTFGPGTTNSFIVTSGSTKLDLGGGFYPMAVAGNLVWRDDNLNGLQDTDEPKVAGVVVQAFDANTHQKLAESTTNHDGIYELDYLEKKDIYVKFLIPNGFAPTLARAGADEIDSDVDHSYGLNTTRKFSMWPGVANENIDLGVAFGVLPVEWLEISGKRINNLHQIIWSTARETNVSHYEVERKLENEFKFSSLPGRITANGNTLNINRYLMEDKDVGHKGTYIYRVKQVDFDGKFSYSKWVSLKNNGSQFIDIYPNPARFETNIEVGVTDDAKVEIELRDAASRLIKVIKTGAMQQAGTESYKVSLDNISPGIYSIVVSIDGVSSNLKLIRLD